MVFEREDCVCGRKKKKRRKGRREVFGGKESVIGCEWEKERVKMKKAGMKKAAMKKRTSKGSNSGLFCFVLFFVFLI